MRRKTFMTLLGLILVVPFSSCGIGPTDSGEASKTPASLSESGSSSFEEEDYSYIYVDTSKSYKRWGDRSTSSSSSSSSSSAFSSPLLSVSEPDGTTRQLTFYLNEDKNSYGVRSFNASGTVVIPTTYQGKPVTSIYSFNGSTEMKKLYIPHTILSINRGAFNNCPNLLTIEVSSYNPNYASFDNALYNKDLSELLRFPQARKNLSLSSNVVVIGEYAFYECDLSSVLNWPNTITTIEYGAFMKAKTRQAFVLPSNVTSIGVSAFESCLFKNVTLGNKVTEIKDSAFKRCENLIDITIPASVQTIEDQAFYECSSLVNIKVSNGLVSVGSEAFAYCTNLDSFYVPETLTNLETDAFRKCKATRKFSCHAQNLKYASLDNVLYTKNLSTLIKCPAKKTSISLPQNLNTIEAYAFEYCTALKSINIPNSVSSLGQYAFFCCTNLKEVTIGSSIRVIKEYAFSDCERLKTVNVNSLLVEIRDYAFKRCPLSYFEISKTVRSIGECAFVGNDMTEIYFPDSVQTIGESAFAYSYSMTSVHFGIGIRSISAKAFYNCSHLSSFEYDGTVSEWQGVYRNYEVSYGCLTHNVTCSDGIGTI